MVLGATDERGGWGSPVALLSRGVRGWGSGMIETRRLRIVPCELRHFEAILTDPGRLGRMLGATVLDDSFDFPGVADIGAMRFMHRRLKADPGLLGWWTHLFVHAKDGVLIGPGGYKGRADGAGAVEIGYAIVPAYRRQGLATEAAQGLIDYAFAHPHVKRVDARTLAERNDSAKVLERVGMKLMGSAADPDVGKTWHWSLRRSDLATCHDATGEAEEVGHGTYAAPR